MHRLTGLLLLLLAAACGNPVDATYAGDPLVTLRGEASLSATDRPDGPVRLTLAWYPGLVDDSAVPPSAPASILTEDVPFQATFPADFALPLHQPPPAGARVAVGGQVRGRAATGFLLAYRDLNGNERLDTRPSTGAGPSQDRVVGASWGGVDSYVLLYVEEAQDPGTGLKRGFNLLHVTPEGGEVLPLDAPIPLALSAGGPLLDLLACETAWDGLPDSELPCGLSFEPPPPQPGTLRVEGTVSLEVRAVRVNLSVIRDDVWLSDATVTLGGRPIPYTNERGAYFLEEADSTLLTEGGTVELVARWGDTVTRRLLTVPEGFSITSPAPGAQVRAGTEFDVEWTASTGAVGYAATLLAPDGQQGYFAFVSETSTPLRAPPSEGPATLRVAAVSRPTDLSRLGWLEVECVRTRPLTVVP
ncbi:hypothetical protein HPC49_50890 [Pyxidicoccus fallax]|uniref:Lipoprotein n=1 Tax=Pyxidicoccus fallax TaxID=394095 RepID=A0A848LUF4_9BACT|nr:hypothetical protein [Pyxidicoccus fallax]NMO21647.1 hypothetical protein [Pyxidicoccus fallax]NPC86482.1 hypothetical protein [Pyxidicoccus fallax]